MQELYYIGLDVHKKSISFCIKTQDGTIVARGQVAATRAALTAWASALERPWVGALEATLFSGWIHDHLKPFAQQLQVAHPAMLKAIPCGKKKNDRLDASKICDLLRCDLLPPCYLGPPALRELRRVLRYRNLLVGRKVASGSTLEKRPDGKMGLPTGTSVHVVAPNRFLRLWSWGLFLALIAVAPDIQPTSAAQTAPLSGDVLWLPADFHSQEDTLALSVVRTVYLLIFA